MTDFRSRILAGETLIGSFSDLGSPLAAELLGRAGMDWTVLDLEHGAATEADLLALLYAVGTTPMAAIVRPQSAERLRVGRALDLGAVDFVPKPGGAISLKMDAFGPLLIEKTLSICK